MPKLALFEDFIALLEQHNQHKYADRLPLDANSMFVVDDEKQRSKMALAFSVRSKRIWQSMKKGPPISSKAATRVRPSWTGWY